MQYISNCTALFIKEEKMKKGFWATHNAKLSKQFTFLAGKKIVIHKLNADDDSIGYTKKGNGERADIYSNPEHHMVSDLDDTHKVAFNIGIDTHELGHQLFTDFDQYEQFRKCLSFGNNVVLKQFFRNYGCEELFTPLKERMDNNHLSIFHDIWNIIEDPSIEYWILDRYSGLYNKCLRYAIAFSLNMQTEITTASSPFDQLRAAFIFFGDCGIIKGKFTFPEAEKKFYELVSFFNFLIEEKSAGKRLCNAYYIYNQMLDMIEQEIKEQNEMMEAFKNALKEFLEKNNIGSGTFSKDASESGNKESDETDEKTPTSSKRRLKFLKKLMEKTEMGSETKSEGDDAECASPSDCGEDDKSDEKSKDEADSSESSESENNNADNNPDNKDDVKLQKDPERMRYNDSEGIDDDQIDNDEVTEIRDYELTEEDISAIKKSIKETENESKKEKDEKNPNLPDFKDLTGRGYNKASCLNIAPSSGSDEVKEEYNTLVNELSGDIRRMTAKLKRAAEKPNIVKTKKSSGRLSVERYSKLNAVQTTKLFDKRRISGDSDIAVCIAVDESGSMCGYRTTSARKATIALAESCSQVNIPLYVMGFTADTHGYDAVHYHYVRWKNNNSQRYSLMNIQARSNNFDGYSIRYATRILEKRPERKKLLVVVSDGQPAARRYGGGVCGIADTKEAVRQGIQKNIIVHGIAIGSDVEVLKEMYGVNFTQNSDLSKLLLDFINTVVRQIKKE